LERWFDRASRSKDVRAACAVAAHLALLFSSTPPEELSAEGAATLLSAEVFLAHNFDWSVEGQEVASGGGAVADAGAGAAAEPRHESRPLRRKKRRSFSSGQPETGNSLGVSQCALFDLFHRMRHVIVSRLRRSDAERAETLEAVIRVVTFTGARVAAQCALAPRRWVEMDAAENAGRFIVVSSPSARPAAAKAQASSASDSEAPAVEASGGEASGGAAGGTSGAELALAPGGLTRVSSSAAGVVSPTSDFGAWLAREEISRAARHEVNVQLGQYCASP
jgi:hypothetical protein